MSNRLGGKQSSSYIGNNANQPPNWTFEIRDPTIYDTQNVVIGDLWINKVSKLVWILTSLAADPITYPDYTKSIATWTLLTIREINTISGNDMTPIFPDMTNNITIEGDGTTIDITGNPGSNTLTMSAVSGGFVATMEGNSGGPVPSDSNSNINLVGDGLTIDIVGNPGTSTLTATILNPADFALTGNIGGRVDVDMSGNINVVGDGTTIDVTGNPGTNTLTMSLIGTGISASLTGDSGGPVGSAAGNINILGAGGVSVIGTPLSNTLTLNRSSTMATSFATDSGSAVPAAGILTIAGGTNINTAGAGSTVTANLDGTITGLGSVTVNNLTVNTSTTLTGLGEGVVQSSSSGVLSSSKGTDGQLLIAASSGAPAWSTLTAGANISIVNAANSVTISRSTTGGNGWVFIASGSSTFTSGITSAYNTLVLVASNIQISGTGSATSFLVQLSTNGGASYLNSSYVSGAKTYDVMVSAVNSTTSTTGLLAGYISTQFILSRSSYVMYIYNIQGTTGNVSSISNGTIGQFAALRPQFTTASGIYTGVLSGPVNAISVTPTGGTAAYSLYGLTT